MSDDKKDGIYLGDKPSKSSEGLTEAIESIFGSNEPSNKQENTVELDNEPVFEDMEEAITTTDTITSEHTYEKQANKTSKSMSSNTRMINPKYRRLMNKDTAFVFLFGRRQVGKTAIMSSLVYHMSIDTTGILEVRNKSQNKTSALYLRNMVNSLDKGAFLGRTDRSRIWELDLTYKPNGNPPMNFTFLEMSGEVLEQVELSDNTNEELPNDIDIYLKCPSLNVCFLIIIPINEIINPPDHETIPNKKVNHSDLAIDFLDHIKEVDPTKFQKPKILLLLSKWDLYDEKHQHDPETFVKEHLPQLYARLKSLKGAVGMYSLGEVDTESNEIELINLERPEAVKRWLYKAITSRKIREDVPLVERLKRFFLK